VVAVSFQIFLCRLFTDGIELHGEMFELHLLKEAF